MHWLIFKEPCLSLNNSPKPISRNRCCVFLWAMMMENIKQEVKMDPEMMENDLLEMTVVISNVTSTFQ